MANVLKYLTGALSKRAKRKGNLAVGIGEENYGPSSTTGYYAGVTPPEDGFVVYATGSNNNPKAFVANSEDDLPAIARTLGGGVLDVLDAKNYIAGLDHAWIIDSVPSNTITDGLVLDLNAKNPTSFIDNKPTVNFFDDGHFPLGQDMAKENGSNPTNQVIYFPSNPGNSNYVLEQTMGVSYTEYQINLTTELQPSTTYCLSGWYAESANYVGESRMFHCRAFSSSGAHVALGTGLYNVVKTVVIDGITWKYCYATITTPADYNNNFNWYVGYSGGSYTGARYYTNLQMEEGDYPTPYSAGARNQNDKFYDLSGENLSGSILNSVTFNPSGWFDFDGVDDKIITNDITGPQSYTFDFVAKNKGGTGYLIYKNNSMNYVDNADNGDVYFSGTDVRFHTEYDTTGDDKTTPSISGAITLNKFAHVVATYDYSSKVQKIYVDGELKSSIDNSSQPGNLYRGNKFYSIGVQGYSNHGGNTVDNYFLSGSISSVKIYDKALSLSEVQQNYYGGPIVTNGLIFAMDAGNLVSYESGSSTTYSLTGSDSGTLSNGVAYNSKNGGVWEFDGIDDHINLGDNSLFDFTNGICTVEAVIKFPSSWTGGSQYPNIVSKGATAGWDTDGWALFGFRDWPSAGQKSWGFGIRNGATNRIVYIANRATDVYLHVVAILDGSTMRLYENGVPVNTNTQTINPASNSTNVYIGRDAASNYFPGDIPYVRAYNRVLTPSEVLQNYNAQKARFGI